MVAIYKSPQNLKGPRRVEERTTKLDITTNKHPNTEVKLILSPKRKTPIAKPKTMREYLKGVIAETSPIRIAETIALYPTTPNRTPNIKNRPVLISGHRNGSPKNNVRTMPDIATDRNPCMPRVKIFSDFETARLARSLPAKPNIPSTANIDRKEKLSAVG